MNKICPICGKDKSVYDSTLKCAKFHDWRGSWRKDKTSEKYKQYLKRRHEAMKKIVRKKLEALNKKTQVEYANRTRKNVKII
jgi:fructose/tagatose bisphosphate aldolase